MRILDGNDGIINNLLDGAMQQYLAAGEGGHFILIKKIDNPKPPSKIPIRLKKNKKGTDVDSFLIRPEETSALFRN